VEVGGGDLAAWERLTPLVVPLLDQERDALVLADRVADQYEEIELLYTMAETLGRTIGLEEACRVIVREVGVVMGARRATIMVHDAPREVLRPVAGWGVDVAPFDVVSVHDADSVAARVFRERRAIVHDPRDPAPAFVAADGRPYRGRAFLSVPITYPEPGGEPRPVGVINLTDRSGTDAFTNGDVKLVTAIANQIAAMIENARLVERDRRQQRLSREMELANDLQLTLLKPPRIPGVDVAARCAPAESVGGDFYHLVRLPERRLGVMLGDVSSHGFRAALMMATVLSAAGIHAEDATSPDETLRRLLETVGRDLTESEMFLTLFYGVTDAAAGLLRYANAGHPHAFIVRPDGSAERLQATSPPLGLVGPEAIGGDVTGWAPGDDLMVLFSDGIVDAADADGNAFGEGRVLTHVREHRNAPAEAIVAGVFDALEAFAAGRVDDRTLLVLRG
jgi:sigma-B regulation protein RsbU (phosphoserine phosphatase)